MYWENASKFSVLINIVMAGVHHDHVGAGQRAQGDRETAGRGNDPF